ncbi:hypothetical protein [Aliamphritea spongicola]|nr:hypothetical protein [Aliamphritea spongicola]
MPWASDEDDSHLIRAEALLSQSEAAGFTVISQRTGPPKPSNGDNSKAGKKQIQQQHLLHCHRR